MAKRPQSTPQLPFPVEAADFLASEEVLVAVAVELGASEVPGWSSQEQRLLARMLPPVLPALVNEMRRKIRAGEDPLGERLCQLRTAEERRKRGAVYTPFRIVEWMLSQVTNIPDRVVDPGTGSARFLTSAGRRFNNAELIGIEIDPLTAIIARANLAAARLASRSTVILGDYRSTTMKPIPGRTLYIGNPPYIRHHELDSDGKAWLTREATRLGLAASQLSGLHVYFYLATALQAQAKDLGAFITAAEWLDVNYGGLVRGLFAGPLGGTRIDVIEPTASPFPDAASTAAIAAFEVGSKPRSIILRRVESMCGLDDDSQVRVVRRERLEAERRWSHLTRGRRKGPSGFVELGELCRVHRGQVTGANKVWIAGEHSRELPASVMYRSVTKARELFRAGKVLHDASHLRNVIDLPEDLDVFGGEEKKAIQQFLARARKQGADKTYTAANRKVWWSIGLRDPAPILATYMARRPPAFVRNLAEARHINIAHGLYPREPLTEKVITNLVEYLAHGTSVRDGRTYAGGLTKFEPREMERVLVPGLEILRECVPL